MPVVRRLFTKPVWWWERNRKYRVRMRYLNLPPLSVGQGPLQYVVLATPAGLTDALWSAWSWYRYLQPLHFQLQLAIDGTLQKQDEATVRGLFPGISIFETRPLVASLGQQRPGLNAFLHGHPLGRKLAVLLALSQRHSFLYSDHDVLAFNSPLEIIDYARTDRPCYIQEESEGNLDCAITRISKELGLDYISRLNSGLLHIPCNSLSIDLAAKLLAGWSSQSPSWFTEQTVLSVLMRHCDAHSLPAGRYVVSSRRQFYWQDDVDYGTIVARHFTGTVRHMMYRAGIPVILRQSRTRQLNGTERAG